MNQVKKELVPKLRFKEFEKDGDWSQELGSALFDSISNKKHKSDLPILAITQEHGAIPRDKIDYRVSVTEKSIESYKVVEVGDFIISLRSFQGGIEYSTYKGLCSPAYVILRKKRDDSEGFFRYYFKTNQFIKELNKDIEGIRDGKMVSYDQFSNLLISLPRSKDEQKKIADSLLSLDELIETEDKKLETLRTYKKGLMQQLFLQFGETTPRLRFLEFKDDGDWEEKDIESICQEIFSGGTPSTINKSYYNGNIPFIRSGEINKETTELFLSEGGLTNSATKLIKKGDILVALYGANSGEVSIAKLDGAINQAILCLKSNSFNDFIYHYLTHKKDWLISTYTQGGQGNLSGEIIKSVIIKIPQNPKEQRTIADFLSSIDDIITSQNQKLKSLRLHKKGLMQQLFPNISEAQ